MKIRLRLSTNGSGGFMKITNPFISKMAFSSGLRGDLTNKLMYIPEEQNRQAPRDFTNEFFYATDSLPVPVRQQMIASNAVLVPTRNAITSIGESAKQLKIESYAIYNDGEDTAQYSPAFIKYYGAHEYPEDKRIKSMRVTVCSDYHTTDELASGLNHEVGHVLSASDAHLNGKILSETSTFRKYCDMDIKEAPEEVVQQLPYYFQKGKKGNTDSGYEEISAEMHSRLALGNGQEEGQSAVLFEKTFPRVKKMVAEDLGVHGISVVR